MSIRVMQWVWENSPASRGERLVLLAIADCASDDGTKAWPSMETIAQKANLSVRACQAAIRRLTKEGHLTVAMQTGPHRCNRYTVVMTGVKKEQVSKLRGEETAGVKLPPTKGEVIGVGRVKFPTEEGEVGFTRTVLEPSMEPSDEPSDARAFNQRVNDLANRWCEMVPLSKLNKVKSVLAKAIGLGNTDSQLVAAMDSLVGHYGLTEDTLRIALQDLAPKRRQSTTNGRVIAGLELAAEYETVEQRAIEG